MRRRTRGAATTILVRDAAPADPPAIARVHVQAWRETYAGIMTAEALAGLSESQREAMWRRWFERSEPRARLVVAQPDDGPVVGFAAGGPVRADSAALATEAELYAIYLLQSVQRQGVGRRLMAAVFDHLRASGFGSVGLWVIKDNIAARFYDRLGGIAGPTQRFEIQGQSLTEIGYRFAPIPEL